MSLETPDQTRFRSEVRALLADSATRAALPGPAGLGGEVDPRPVYRLLGERRWLAPAWPREYGGLGGGAVEAGIVTEELALSGVPDSGYVNSVQNAGNFLLAAGSDAQRERFLPPLARGDLLIAILYSEPEAGSDLAALQTRAERVDGGWRLTGRKVYNVGTPLAQFALTAARTSEGATKYSGLTLFMVPLDRPEVRIEPLDTLVPDRLYRVDLDGVTVTDDDVVGDPGDGWMLISSALSIERTGLDFNAKVRRWWQDLHELAQASGRLDRDPVAADELDELRARLDAGRALAWRLVRQLVDGDIDPAEAAMSKWLNSELGRDVALAASRLGAVGPADADGLTPEYREAAGVTLAGGSSNVMLYLVAGELGL